MLPRAHEAEGMSERVGGNQIQWGTVAARATTKTSYKLLTTQPNPTVVDNLTNSANAPYKGQQSCLLSWHMNCSPAPRIHGEQQNTTMDTAAMRCINFTRNYEHRHMLTPHNTPAQGSQATLANTPLAGVVTNGSPWLHMLTTAEGS